MSRAYYFCYSDLSLHQSKHDVFYGRKCDQCVKDFNSRTVLTEQNDTREKN